jgi:repressor LexA
MRPGPDITQRQATILQFIQNKINQEGRPPTLREIGRQFGFTSTGTTRDHLKSLAQKGYIRLHPRQARAIETVKPLAFRIPILGRITAGTPNLALEEAEGTLALDGLLPSTQRETFALKIKGDSMVDKGIHEGDIAVIVRQRTASPGDIVAALLENEATIKTLRKKGSGYFLEPANRNYPDIHKPFSILGRVIAVIKMF